MLNYNDKLAKRKNKNNRNELKSWDAIIRFTIATASFFFILNFCSPAQTKVNFTIKTRSKDLPFKLTANVPEYYPQISIALSGGGARGFCQIGALKVLQEEKIYFSQIYGISIGSLIGGMLAAGYDIDDIDSILTSFNWNKLLAIDSETSRKDLFVEQKITEDRAFLSFNFDGFKLKLPTSIVSGQQFSNYLSVLFLNAPINFEENFDKLRYRYRALATDLANGKQRELNEISLSLAVRASSAISLLVSPVEIDSLILVDGGMTGNIPVSRAKKNSDYVIAIDATTPLFPKEKLNQPLAIADQMISIPINLLASKELEIADCVIKPDLKNHRNSDFYNFRFLISKGELEAKKKIPKIRNDIRTLFKQHEKNNLFIPQPFILKIDDLKINPHIFYHFQYDSIFVSDVKYFVSDLIIENDITYAECNIDISDTLSIINVKLHRKPLVKRIQISGCSFFDKSAIENLFRHLENQPYNSNKILEASLAALMLYRRHNYPFVTISEISFDEIDGSLTIEFNESFAKSLTIEGLQTTKSYVVRREFEYLKKEKPTTYQVFESLNSLKSSNLFSALDANIRKYKDNEFSFSIKLKEKQFNYLRIGIKADNEYKFQGMFDIRNENLNGSGTEAGLTIVSGIKNRYFSLDHKAIRIFNTYLTYKISPFYDYRVYNFYAPNPLVKANYFENIKTGEYKKISYGAYLSFGTQLEKFGNLIFTLQRSADLIKDKTNLLNLSRKKINLTLFKVSSTIDTQDKYPYPDEGFYSQTIFETSSTNFFSDIGYVKVSLLYRVFAPINTSHNLSLKLETGYADETTPFSQKFSFGGLNSFFGFREYEKLGRQIFIFGLDYRYKIPLDLLFPPYLKLTYNLGNIWDFRNQIKFKDLYHGFGFTLSFKTPIGPADFSLGKAFKLKATYQRAEIIQSPLYGYFSIGYPF